MKKFLFLISCIYLVSCSQPTNDKSQKEGKPTIKKTEQQLKIEGVLHEYFDASNKKDFSSLLNLIYPELFNGISKEEVEGVFYSRLNSMKKIQFTNLEFDEVAVLLEENPVVKVYSQKFKSRTEMALDTSIPLQNFEGLSKSIRSIDSEAKINKENYEMSYSDKKKLMVIESKNTFYVMPEDLWKSLDTDEFDKTKVLNSYKATP